MKFRSMLFAAALALSAPMVLLSSGAAQANVAGQLMSDLQRDLGLTNAQAAGIVGNLAHETGNFRFMQEISPVVAGSRGGYGYAQWTGPRRREFEAYASANGLNLNSHEANYGYLLHEISSGAHGNLDRVRNAATPEEAAQYFMEDYLRPGVPHLDARVGYANLFADGNFEGSPELGNLPGGGTGGIDEPTEIPDAKLMLWMASGTRGAMPAGAF